MARGTMIAAACAGAILMSTACGVRGPDLAPYSIASAAPPGHSTTSNSPGAAKGRIVATIQVGDRPQGIAAGFGSIWVTNHGDDSVSRIDPTTNQVVATIRVGRGPGHVVDGYGAVWVTDDEDTSLWRIDPKTNRAQAIGVGGRISCQPALFRGVVWVTVWDSATLVGVNARNAKIISRMPIPPQPLGVQVGGGSFWVANMAEGGGTVSRIDPTTGRSIATFVFPEWPWFMGSSFGQGSIWVSDAFERTLTRIDVMTDRVVAKISVGDLPVSNFAKGSVWVSSSDGTLSRIDAQTQKLVDTIKVGTSQGGVAVAFGSVWVASFSEHLVSRIVEEGDVPERPPTFEIWANR